MNKKIKLAMLAMLGFSTACSTSKRSAKSGAPETEAQPSEVIEHPRIQVMYGVRPPVQVEVDTPQTELLPETDAKAEASRNNEPAAVQEAEPEAIEVPRTVVMYGVRRPYPVAVKDSVVKGGVLQSEAAETDRQIEE